MPTLVNYSGDDDFYPGSSFYPYPMDFVRLLPSASHNEVFFPPSKRSRITARFDLEQNPKPSIDVLPDECLFEIFRRLQSRKERSSCACVSRKWLMLLSSISRSEICNDTVKISVEQDQGLESDGFLTRNLEGNKATDVRLAAISVGTNGHGGLGKLSIRGTNSTRGVTNLGLSAIARGCPSLRTLSLWGLSSVGDEGLFKIAKECHLLERLDLSQCPSISNRGLTAIAESCPNLTVLNIESSPKIGNEGLQAIGKLCQKLQSISIRDCPLVGDHGVSSLLSSGSSVLTKVKLQSLNITDFSLAVIGHYGMNITNLILNSLQNVSEKGFWVMGNAKGLKKLISFTITSCRGMSDLSLEALARGCVNLKQMCLRKCCFFSDNGLSSFAKLAGSLESFQLEECNRVTSLGIINVLSNRVSNFKSLTLIKCMGIKDTPLAGAALPSPCTSIRLVSIKNCPGFNSASLSVIGKLCPKLRNLDLSGLYGITDLALRPLLENCQGLIKVNLNGCLNLTDETVLSLTKLHGETLELLNLEGCRKISDTSLVAIAEMCILLKELDVSKCAISDSGLAVLSCAEQIALQVLSLSGCSEISNKSLPLLKRLGKTLAGLNLKNCYSISSGGIDMLIESLWKCDILV